MNPGDLRTAVRPSGTAGPSTPAPRPTAERSRRRRGLLVLGTLAGLALAAVLLRGRGSEVLAALGRADWRPVVVAVVVLLAANAARAVRLRRLLPAPALPPAAALEVTTTYNLLTGLVPGGLGELALPVRLARRHGTPRAEAASVLLLTRVLDVVGLLGALAVSAAATADLRWARAPVAAVALAGAAVVVLVVLRLGRGTRHDPARVVRVAEGPHRRRAGVAARLLSVHRALRRQAGAVDAVSWWTTAALWAGTSTGLVLLAGAVGTRVPLLAGGVLAGVVFGLASLPVPALAGIGLTDAGWALGLLLLTDVSGDRAVGSAFALHGLSLVAVAAVALVGALAPPLARRRQASVAAGAPPSTPDARPGSSSRAVASRPSPWRWTVPAATVATGLHAALVWPRYGFGSFDDDGHYLLTARALAAGRGFLDTSRLGDPVDPLIPPGYPALLAPLDALPGDLATAGRLLSLLCVLLLVPLTDRWLRGAGVGGGARAAVLALLAGNVVLATYASMVMAEAPFLVVLLLALLALRRAGERLPGMPRPRAVATGVGLGLLLAALVLLKTAAVGLVAGAGLWLLLRRHLTAAASAGVVVVATQLPLLVVRAAQGASVVGDRYAGEIGTFEGPLQLLAALARLVTRAMGDTVVPIAPFVRLAEPLDLALAVARVLVSLAVAVGAVLWWRRTRDAAAVMAAVYLVEVLFFPFMNERRVVLVLPLVLAWLVLGGEASLQALARRGGGVLPGAGRPRRQGLLPRRAVRPVAGAALGLLLLGLLLQVDRNYLYRPGDSSPRPAEFAAVAMAQELVAADRAAGRDVRVQTTFRWTTSLLTGAHTNNALFARVAPLGLQGREVTCPPDLLDRRADATGSGYAITATWKFPTFLDDPCVRSALGGGAAGAVRLVQQPEDDADLYQLLGPGSPWPDDVDHLADGPDVRWVAPSGDGSVEVVVGLDGAATRQVSVGRTEAGGAPVGAARLEVLPAGADPAAGWELVDEAEEPGYLLHRFAEPRGLDAVRVVVAGAPPDALVEVEDLRAIGPRQVPGGR